MSPHNGLTPVALASMDKVIGLYTGVVQTRGGPRFVQNLQWLLRLRQRAVDRISSHNQHQDQSDSAENQTGDPEAELDAGLLGWKTRFIERANVGRSKAITISGPNASVLDQSPLEIDSVIQSLPQAVQDHIFSGDGGGPDPGSTSGQSNATDYFVSLLRLYLSFCTMLTDSCMSFGIHCCCFKMIWPLTKGKVSVR